LWEEYNRILKPQGVVALFGSEPFSTYMRMSNIENYKYDWIWKKSNKTGFQHAKNMPLKDYEIISIFSNASIGHINLLGDKRMIYNPQGIIKIDKVSKNTKNKWGNIAGRRPSHKDVYITEYANYPTMTINFNKDANSFHPTQKPVALLEYLIKTYTDEGMLVLDNCMGSGSTGVACVNTNRKFIGIELDEEFFDKAYNRLKQHVKQLDLFK
jgi:site-specific DNA-methyltransferase (adenine-specific)